MFFSVDLLILKKNRKGRLPRCWIAATTKNFKGKISQRDIDSIDILQACNDIIDGLTANEDIPRLSLRLASLLSYGAIRIFQTQVNDLTEQCEKFLMQSQKNSSKKKSRKTVKTIEKPALSKDETFTLDQELPEYPDLDIEKLFGDLDHTDRHQILEVDPYEANGPLRFPSVFELDDFSTLRSFEVALDDCNNIADNEQQLYPEDNIEPTAPVDFVTENNEALPTLLGNNSQISKNNIEQRDPVESLVEESNVSTPKRKSNETRDSIEQRPSLISYEDPQLPVTPKRKSRMRNNETPTKRKRVLSADFANDSMHQSVINDNIMDFESIPTNDITEIRENQVNENVRQAFTPPTESTGEQPTQAVNLENIIQDTALPILEISNVATTSTSNRSVHSESGLLRPNQIYKQMNLSKSVETGNLASEDRREDNQQSIVEPPLQQSMTDEESEFALLVLDNTKVVSSKKRRVFLDKNKQIKIKYKSNSNALDTICTMAWETYLPNVRGNFDAHSLLSLPSVIGLKVGLKGNKTTYTSSKNLCDLFLNNIKTPGTKQPEKSPHRKDEFVNKKKRKSRMQPNDSIAEPKSRSQIVEENEVLSQRQIDRQLMPPPSAPVSLLHSCEQLSSPQGARESVQATNSEFAASPRQLVTQQRQPSINEPEAHPEVAIPIDEALDTVHEGAAMPIREWQPPEINEIQLEPLHSEDAVPREKQYSDSEGSFLPKMLFERQTESMGNDEMIQYIYLQPSFVFTKEEIRELLEKLWTISIDEFGEPPKVYLDEIFLKTLITKIEVPRYLKYLFEFEQQGILYIKEDNESLFSKYFVCKLEESENNN